MDENRLLNNTLDILEKQGAEQAYDYLVENQKLVFQTNRSQIYNFLYCLAAVSEKKEEALSWLEEAIIKRKYWYRPEVFEDSDLESLIGEERFEHCRSISHERYILAQNQTKTIHTWSHNTSDKILLALHGNQQNIEIAKNDWKFMNNHGYQVEYVQSCELDSYELFRWEDNGSGASQLLDVCDTIGWNEYNTGILCAFSSGCNVILKAFSENNILNLVSPANCNMHCNYIIFQSPWIPVVNEEIDPILKVLAENKTKLLIVCGDRDEDCAPLVKILEQKARRFSIDINTIWIKGLSHEFPENFESLVINYLPLN